MNDEQIIEYLRLRGRADVPQGLVGSVMSAVDAAPPTRSWFAAYLPATAAVAVVALIALAIAFGPGRTVGPAASPSVSATPVAATVGQLEAELTDAIEVLRGAPVVHGRQSAMLRDVLAMAMWFDWRPNGDYVAIQRADLDVTQTGWWMDPTAAPSTTGERVETSIWAFIGDRLFFGGPDEWVSMSREDGPNVVSYGTGLLDGVTDPVVMLGGLGSGLPYVGPGDLARRVDADGGVTWTAETPWRGGSAIQVWRIGPDGGLESWAWELVDVAPNPDLDFGGNATASTLVFERFDDLDPIPVPDLTEPPDPAVFGLPNDFPLAPTSTPEPVGARP